MANLLDEILEMFSSEFEKEDRKEKITSIIEPFIHQIIIIFKQQLGHYLQIFGISFIIILIVSLINLSILIQHTNTLGLTTVHN